MRCYDALCASGRDCANLRSSERPGVPGSCLTGSRTRRALLSCVYPVRERFVGKRMAELGTDFLNVERKVRLRAAWERAVVEAPLDAYQFGPPNWLVCEEWDRKGESFEAASVRVKVRYFPEPPDVTVWRHSEPRSVTEVAPSVTSVTTSVTEKLCPVCGRNPISGKQKVCSARCRKRRQRGA